MDLSTILNLVLGGSLAATLLQVMSLKSRVRQAEAEADEADAEAERLRIDNAGQATRILMENIVEPLKHELNDVRKELDATRTELSSVCRELEATRRELAATKRGFRDLKREVVQLRKAMDEATVCPHADGCPVLHQLHHEPPHTAADALPPEPDGAEGRQPEQPDQQAD